MINLNSFNPFKKCCKSSKENPRLENHRLSIVSYNIMYNDVCRTNRNRRILKLLKGLNPDVILLQEMHFSQLERYKRHLKNYITSPLLEQYIRTKQMGNIIFIKRTTFTTEISFRVVPYRATFMERSMCTAKVGEYLFVSTHLESFPSQQFVLIREQQLMQLTNHLNTYTEHKIVVGIDSNIDGPIDDMRSFTCVFDEYPMTWVSKRYFNYNTKKSYDKVYLKGCDYVNKIMIEADCSDHNCLYVDLISTQGTYS